MNDERRIFELFTAAVRLPQEERASFLEGECGEDLELRSEVESLLEHEETDVLERAGQAVASDLRELGSSSFAGAGAGASMPGFPDFPELPDFIGDYRIIEVIGSGGMGVVYEAEQQNPSRRVALKIVRPGLATPALLRRFQHEAQVLGWLDHPGIARIYEAGTADTGFGPQPFFAMELVRGEPIGRFAAARGLDIRARLELVARVAEAVHHAHLKGVVHRDLKPHNVLVGADEQPKVLDFGVARVTDSDLKTTTALTNVGELVGTLPYMSPEQVSGDLAALDARSDVYSLGVLAFELLSGQLPHDVAQLPLPEAARRISEDEPTTLSSFDRRFRGDIEIIVGKALAVEKERRYASAEEFAADLRRHLADEPIQARPPSSLYQLAKFARRNRALVAGVALAFVALAVGAIVSTIQFLDARDGWAAERAQRQTAGRVSEFLVDLFQVPDTSRDWGESITARELLDRGARTIRGELADQPLVRARLMRTIGRVYGNLGLYDDARPLIEEALQLHRERAEPDELALTLYRLANLDRLAGRYASSEERMCEARDVLYDSVQLDSWKGYKTLETLHRAEVAELDQEGLEVYTTVIGGLAGVQTLRGEYGEAWKNAKIALELTIQAHGEDSVEASVPLTTLAVIHQERDEWPEALATAEEVLALRRAHLDDEHPDLVEALDLVAMIRFEQGDTAAALELAREVHEIKTRRLPEGHPGRAAAMHDLATSLLDHGEPQEAEELLLVVRDRTLDLYGESNPRHADSLHALGAAQAELSKFVEAEANLRAALAIRERTLGERHLHVASTLNQLGTMLTLGPRRPLEAIPLLERALDIATSELGGPERALVATILGNLGNAQGYANRLDDAAKTQVELLALYKELRGPEHPDVARTLHNVAMVFHSLGDYETALDYAYECRDVHDAVLPEGHPNRAFNHDSIGRSLLELKRFDEAEIEFRRSAAIREASLPEGHIHIGESLAMIAYCLIEREAFEDAEPLLLRALEICEATYPATHPQMRFVLARVQNLYRLWGRHAEADRWLERLEAAGGG